jgi:hypothetical protein
VSTTQTGAGQVGSSTKPGGSKKGLWLGLGAVLLVGGGVTAGVLIASGGGGDKETVASNTPAPAPDPTQAPSDPTQTPAPPSPTPAPTPAPPAPTPANPTAPGQATTTPPANPNRATPAPPSTAKKPPPDTTDDEDDADDAPAPKTGAGLGPDGWVVSRNFSPPGSFDPKKVDTSKYLAWALAEAKKLAPDAVLFRIDASGVFPDGHADFTIVDNGDLDYRFISPSRAKRDPSKPIGAKQEQKCMFRVQLSKEGAWSAPMNGWECKEKLVGPPKCTFAQVWKKALARNAPSNAVAELGYRADFNGVAKWYVGIDDPDSKFSEIFDDDCR